MLNRPIQLLLGFVINSFVTMHAQESMYIGKAGQVHFTSDAPLEMIKASSDELSGAIDPSNNGVAFSLRVVTFQGFNSAVQRDHFLENYMEAGKFPVATFSGKIIEKLDFNQPGEYSVRIKGMLNIHGMSTERIIPGTLQIQGGTITGSATFSVPLTEHAITIPKLLSQKIAETILVKIEITLQRAQ